jgi:hypothetical protein
VCAQDDEGSRASGCCSSPSQLAHSAVQSGIAAASKAAADRPCRLRSGCTLLLLKTQPHSIPMMALLGSFPHAAVTQHPRIA